MMDMEASLIPERQGNTSELQNIYEDKKKEKFLFQSCCSVSEHCYYLQTINEN